MSDIKTLIKSIFMIRKTNREKDYNTWIFSSSYNNKFNYNSKALFEYVIKNEPKINPIFIINDDELRNNLQNEYGKQYFIETKTNAGIKKVLNSGVWFISAGLPIYGVNLNKERIIVNLWHGVPLKKIGLMEENFNKARKIYFKSFFSNNYSHILTTSKNLVSIMAKSFGVEESIIKIWGQPRNDLIFEQKNKKDILNTLYKDIPDYKKVMLYAPTFREFGETKFFPFIDFNEKRLSDFLDREKLIIFIRCHQFESNMIEGKYGERVILINDDIVEEIMDIINIFDLLITDYSSIYIDYLLIQKPILFLPYDIEEYSEKRGFNFEYASVTPGPKPKSFKDFKSEIKKLLEDKDYYEDERINLNDFFNSLKQQCSNTICENIKEEIITKKNKNKGR